jgi:hypothetical protein
MPDVQQRENESPEPGGGTIPARLADKRTDPAWPIARIREFVEQVPDVRLTLWELYEGRASREARDDFFESLAPALSEIAVLVELPKLADDSPLLDWVETRSRIAAVSSKSSRKSYRIYFRSDLEAAYETALASTQTPTQAPGGGVDYVETFLVAFRRAIQDVFLVKLGLPSGGRVPPSLRTAAASYTEREFLERCLPVAPVHEPGEYDPPPSPRGGAVADELEPSRTDPTETFVHTGLMVTPDGLGGPVGLIEVCGRPAEQAEAVVDVACLRAPMAYSRPGVECRAGWDVGDGREQGQSSKGPNEAIILAAANEPMALASAAFSPDLGRFRELLRVDPEEAYRHARAAEAYAQDVRAILVSTAPTGLPGAGPQQVEGDATGEASLSGLSARETVERLQSLRGKDAIQKFLDAFVVGRSWGDAEDNYRVADGVSVHLKAEKLRVRCWHTWSDEQKAAAKKKTGKDLPEQCSQPSLLRCYATPGSPSGIFRLQHSKHGRPTSHCFSKTVPQLDLIPAAPDLRRKK